MWRILLNMLAGLALLTGFIGLLVLQMWLTCRPGVWQLLCPIAP